MNIEEESTMNQDGPKEESQAVNYGVTYHKAPWRTGRRVYRTIYATQQDRQARDRDPLIGVMDTPGLAREAVAAHNDRLSRRARTMNQDATSLPPSVQAEITDEVFERTYRRTVEFIAGEFGSKETYRVFGKFLLEELSPTSLIGPTAIARVGADCCGKPQGCTNPTDGCLYKQHPSKRHLYEEVPDA